VTSFANIYLRALVLRDNSYVTYIPIHTRHFTNLPDVFVIKKNAWGQTIDKIHDGTSRLYAPRVRHPFFMTFRVSC